MAEAKALIWVLNYIGIPTAIVGWLLNVLPVTAGGWPAAVIGFIGIFFALAKLVVYCITSYQNIKMRQMQLKAKEKKMNGN